MGCQLGTARRRSNELRWECGLYDDFINDDDASDINSTISSGTRDNNSKFALKWKLTDFKMGKKLGNGSFGTVRECIHRKTGWKYAVKIIKKSSSNDIFINNKPFDINRHHISDNLLLQNSDDASKTGELMIQNEAWILQRIRHENIIQSFAFFEDKQYCYLIIDYCEGGELFDRIAHRTCSTETDAIVVIKQACSAISHLHDLGIVHRDIKAENFLFKSKNRANSLVLIDFGMASHVPKGNYLSVFCGSIHYISPEVLEQRYSLPSDMWALGVLTYLILTGTYPYMENDFEKLKMMILNKPFNQTDERYKRLSPEAKGFICGLLEKDPIKRMTADQALDHPWLRRYYSIPKSEFTKGKSRSLSRSLSKLVSRGNVNNNNHNKNRYETHNYISNNFVHS